MFQAQPLSSKELYNKTKLVPRCEHLIYNNSVKNEENFVITLATHVFFL